MRSVLLLVALALAGCADGSEPVATTPVSDVDLDVYVFWFPEADGMPSQAGGTSLDYMVRVTNQEDHAVRYTFNTTTVSEGSLGPVVDGAWDSSPIHGDAPAIAEDTLAANESRLWIVQGTWFCCHWTTVHVQVDNETVFRQEFTTGDGAGSQVEAGSHLQTVTVGVWANGTSFYTNSPEMLADPDFPAGGHINRTQAAAESSPLPIYVYAQVNTEQPPSSRDNCYFTTITGYNALLKQQTTGASGVRFLQPEEAYTRAGAEAHFLYGDALIFMNAIVAVDSTPEIVDTSLAPDPNGACFGMGENTQNYLAERIPT